MIKVGIADYKITTNTNYLITYGLGSCVAVAIYDQEKKLAGMLHIMLPMQTIKREKVNLLKYVDPGIQLMLEEMLIQGVNRKRLKAKIAGGAKMFSFSSNKEINSNIGEKNIEAVKRNLQELLIPLVAEDTGQNYGRTVEFYPENGDMKIKSLHYGVKII
ncbi:MAG: chemotaxis protein CheD [bacterium]